MLYIYKSMGYIFSEQFFFLYPSSLDPGDMDILTRKIFGQGVGRVNILSWEIAAEHQVMVISQAPSQS